MLHLPVDHQADSLLIFLRHRLARDLLTGRNDRRLKATALRVGRQKLTAACGQFTVGPASENVGSVRIRVVRVTAGLAADVPP